MLPGEVVTIIESHVGVGVEDSTSVGGGCISNATRVRCARGEFFVKWSRGEAAKTFPPEAAGLARLRVAGSPLVVPKPELARDASDGLPGVLMMEWIEAGTISREFWEAFGHGLAALHRHTSERYGLDEDNFIGRSHQRNTWEASWPEFFLRHRLLPQVEEARSTGRWAVAWNEPIERLFRRLPELLPRYPAASILHGDLWSGNFMVDGTGRPVLIDPATYFGHREADLAMTELFGGFDPRFQRAYHEAWPIEEGYAERKDVYNLYHLINHLNHFGSGYSGSIDRVLRTI